MKSVVQIGFFTLFFFSILLRPTFLLAEDPKVKADLAALKSALEKEYQSLAQLKGDLEQARQNAKTDKDVAAFKKKLEIYDQKVQVYNDQRKKYEQKLQAIAEAEAQKRAMLDEALRDQETVAAETGGEKEARTSELTETKAATETEAGAPKEPTELVEQTGEQTQKENGETAKTGPESSNDKAKAALVFKAEKKILDKRKEGIDNEFLMLKKEKEELDSRKKERMILPEANALDQDVNALNEKIKQFDERKIEFEKEVSDFNKRVTDSGLSVSEKKAAETN